MEQVDYNCIFCAIAAKRAPAAIVYESVDALAFLDIHPVVEGHMLVIPKKHCRNLFDLDDECGKAVMHASRVVAARSARVCETSVASLRSSAARSRSSVESTAAAMKKAFALIG